MIPDQWYAVLASSEVKRGRPVGVVRFGRRLVLWRDEEGFPYAERTVSWSPSSAPSRTSST